METKIELQATVTKELSDELYNKLDGNEFENEIDKVTKDFKLDWYLNTETKSLIASRIFMDVERISPAHIYSLHADVCAFVAKVKKLQHEELVPAVSDEQANQTIEDYEFIKELVENWDDKEEGHIITAGVAGFEIMVNIANKLAIPAGHISRNLAKELCMSYLKLHGHEK